MACFWPSVTWPNPWPNSEDGYKSSIREMRKQRRKESNLIPFCRCLPYGGAIQLANARRRPCGALTSRWWLTGGYGPSQMVFRAVPIPGEIFCHPTLPYFSLDSAQIRAVGRTIFDRELFHVDLDDAPVFDADTDNLSVEPIFDDVVFEDIEPNFDDLDDEPLFDTKFDELDKGSVFDTESIPDHVAVSVFEFVRPEYDAELTVFDTDSDSLNDLPVVDMGPVHDAELAVFNQGNDGSSTAHTGVLDGHPVFDVELVFDEEPLIEIDCSIFNTNAPFMCLTDCLSYVDDMVSATFKEGHIFDKETVVEAVQKESGRDYYTAHGENAMFIARTYYHTISALRHLGSNSGGISSVGVSEAMFETIVRKILLDRTDCTLDFYEGSSSDWRLSKSGKPGNIGGFEDILFINNDMQESPVMTNRKLGLAEFREDSRFTNVGSALLALCLTADCEKSINSHSLQDAITKCSILLTERKKSNFKSKDLVQDLEKIRSSVKLVHDLISQFDYSLGALGALLSYAELLANDTNYGNYTIEKYNLDCYMRLDSAAVRALTIHEEKTDVNKNFYLFGLVNRTCTVEMGKILLNQWLKQPLLDVNEITSRLYMVQAAISTFDTKTTIRTVVQIHMCEPAGASRNVEHMSQLQKPWDPGGFHIGLVSRAQRVGFNFREYIELLERYNKAPFSLKT